MEIVELKHQANLLGGSCQGESCEPPSYVGEGG